MARRSSEACIGPTSTWFPAQQLREARVTRRSVRRSRRATRPRRPRDAPDQRPHGQACGRRRRARSRSRRRYGAPRTGRRRAAGVRPEGSVSSASARGSVAPEHEDAAKLFQRPLAGTQQETPPGPAARQDSSGEGREETGAEGLTTCRRRSSSTASTMPRNPAPTSRATSSCRRAARARRSSRHLPARSSRGP